MKPLTINIILPFFTSKPGGGTKIMYEYANRLQERGHQVTVLHSIQRPYRKIKSPVWWKQLSYRLRGLSRPAWFPLNEAVRSRIVPEITDQYVPDADITMSTWWEMTYMISRLDDAKGKKFNLIQDYEVWKGYEDLVHESYRLPVHHLVIAQYLQDLVEKYSGTRPQHIPNAINHQKFRLLKPIEGRDPHSVLMLYSEEPRKATATGVKALSLLKIQYPSLQPHAFGVYEKPDLPSWIQYHYKPDDLPGLMNNMAIFFTPSNGEGWALPPAEAMCCGCALVCTDIGGHADYALDNETALLALPGNAKSMMEKIKTLVDDPHERVRIAGKGNGFIQQFNWENSVARMESLFYEAVTGMIPGGGTDSPGHS